MAGEATVSGRPEGVGALFAAFLEVGLFGFGGVLAMARRVLVERRGWMTGGEFTDLYALCQFLPGPNVCNLSVVLGRRYFGLAGAGAALGGLMAAPVVVALGLGWVFERYGGVPAVAHGLVGLAAAGTGLVLGTAGKLARPLLGRPLAAGMAAVTVLLVAGLRLPLVPTMLVLAPLSVGLHFWWRG